jgi:pyruvate dehydrogenase E2 component (dihydrolipoamide acetyltransferase)
MATGPSTDAVLKLFEEGSYELVKHDGMRKTIAKRLQESKQTIPHFYVSVDCELDALLKLRGELNKAAPVKDDKPAYKLSVNDMVIKALALALRDVPDANVSWTDEAMVKHKHADVGVAVSIPGGLITPIIRAAEDQAAVGHLQRDEGSRQARQGTQAQARGIPGRHDGGLQHGHDGREGLRSRGEPAACDDPRGRRRRTAPGGQGRALAIAQVMTVTLSTDHRCVDGALGAELLGAFKGYIENPMSMLVWWCWV